MIGYSVTEFTKSGYCISGIAGPLFIPDTEKIITFPLHINTNIKSVKKQIVHDLNALLTLSFFRKDIIAKNKNGVVVISKARILDCKVIEKKY